MKKRLAVLLIMIATLLTIVLHKDVIIVSFIKWRADSYCKEMFGSSLRFESITRDSITKFTITRPVIFDTLDNLEGGYKLEARNIELNYSFDITNFLIHANININDPIVSAVKKNDTPPPFSFVYKQLWKIPRFHFEVSVNNGTIQLHDNKNHSGKISFDLSYYDTLQKALTVKLHSTDKDNSVCITCSQYDNDWQTSSIFNDYPIATLSDLIQFFSPELLNEWKVEQGTISGNLDLELSPYLSGKLFITQLKAQHPLFMLETHINKISLDFLGRKIINRKYTGIKSFIDSLTKTTSCELEFLEHGKVLSQHYGWEFNDLSGMILIHPDKGIGIQTQGTFFQDDIYEPFEFIGNLSSPSFLNATISIAQERQIHLTMNTNTHAELRLENADNSVIKFLQSILGPSFPSIKKIKFTKGTFDMLLQANISDKHLSDISIKNLSIKDALLKGVSNPFDIALGDVTGNFSIILDTPEPLSTVSADLTLSRSRFKFPNTPDLEDLNASLSIRNGSLQESQFNVRFAGITTALKLNKQSGKRYISCHFSGEGKDFVALAPNTIDEKIKKIWKKDIITIDATVSHESSNTQTEGVLYLESGDHTDIIDFAFHLKDMMLQKGQFSGNDLLLGKYVSPIIFKNDDAKRNLSLSAHGDISGVFTSKAINIKYCSNNVLLENPRLAIASNTIKNAEHNFDLTNNSHNGHISIQGGSYLEKKSGLYFCDINTTVNFRNDNITINNINTICEGLKLCGDIDIDHKKRNFLNIGIHLKESSGTFPALQQFCSHIDKYHLWELPIKGIVSDSSGKSFINITTSPDMVMFDVGIYGSLSNGSITAPSYNLTSRDVKTDFEYIYNNKNNILNIINTTGRFSIGDDKDHDDYTIYSPFTSLSISPDLTALFDVSINNTNSQTICNLVGNAKKNSLGNIDWLLDKEQCHLGSIIFNISSLTTLRDLTIVAISSAPEINLATFHSDIQLLEKSNILPLKTRYLMQHKPYQSLSGNLKCLIILDEKSPTYNFSINSNDIHIDKKDINHFSLSGEKSPSQWIISSLQYNELTAAARISPQNSDNDWFIDSLHLSYGNSIELDAHGEYSVRDDIFTAQLDAFELDLNKLHKLPSIYSIMKSLKPQGKLQASGTLMFHIFSNPHILDMNSNIEISFQELSLNSISFHNNDTLKDCFCDNPKFILKKFNYNFVTNIFGLDNLEFSIPTNRLECISDLLEYTYSGRAEKNLRNYLIHIKNRETLEGNISIYNSPGGCLWELHIQDGIYVFKEHHHNLEKFSVEYNKNILTFHTQYLYNDHTFWLSGKTNTTAFNDIELTVSDEHPKNMQNTGINPLTLLWERDAHQKLAFKQAEGTVFGLKTYITAINTADSSENLFFQGKIQFNPNEISWLLPEELQNKIEKFKICDGYELIGRCSFSKNSKSLTHFSGALRGKNFGLMGYTFDRLSSQFEYYNNHISIRNFRIDDESGTLSINDININKNEQNNWTLNIPLITIDKFRPYITKKQHLASRQKNRHLLIDTLTLNDLQGELSDNTSFTGNGHAIFSNHRRSQKGRTLFAIPGDLISRIGIDPTLLTPVSGEICYEIKNAKVFFTKFKDIYNDGMISKFYLSNKNKEHSYLDFDGNLHVKVRMKQYNIIFKLAEFFTITIGGTLGNPTHTLQKRPLSNISKTKKHSHS